MTKSSMLDGGCAVAADDAGHVYVVWHAAFEKAPPGQGGEANRTVWVAASDDDGETFAPERDVLPSKLGACGCCGMAAGIFAGRVTILYRAATDGVERGMYLLTSTDNGNTFEARQVDQWNIQVCPASSAMMNTQASQSLLAWENNDQVFWAESRHPITAFAPPGADARRKHPSVADNGDCVLLAWDEGGGWGTESTLAWQAFMEDGSMMNGVRGRKHHMPPYSFPAIIPQSDGFTILY